MSGEEVVAVSVDGGVGVVELARPEKFNCLAMAVHRAIDAALDRFEAPGSGVRVVLIRARGKHFCTGADLDEVLGLRERPEDLQAFISLGHRVLRRLEASALPVVAACQGLSLAGGLTAKGTEKNLQIRRRDAGGHYSTLKGSLTDPLQADDVIYVRESLF